MKYCDMSSLLLLLLLSLGCLALAVDMAAVPKIKVVQARCDLLPVDFHSSQLILPYYLKKGFSFSVRPGFYKGRERSCSTVQPREVMYSYVSRDPALAHGTLFTCLFFTYAVSLLSSCLVNYESLHYISIVHCLRD